MYMDRIPPVLYTKTVMGVLKDRQIPAFVGRFNRLPNSLQELPPLPEQYNSSLKDGWGRNIIYKKYDDGTVELVSYGKDGIPGGTGSNEDIVFKFKIQKTNNH